MLLNDNTINNAVRSRSPREGRGETAARRMRGRRTALGILMTAVMSVLGLINASPAQAAERTDWFSMTSSEVDFGAGGLMFPSGKPSSDGLLDWNLVAGRWEPRLAGLIFINNARDKCVRIQMVVTYQNGFRTTHTDTESDFCAPDGRSWASTVDFRPVSDTYVAWVHFNLQKAPSDTSAFSTEETTAPFFAPWWLS